VGRAGGRQELSLDDGCLHLDTVIHELVRLKIIFLHLYIMGRFSAEYSSFLKKRETLNFLKGQLGKKSSDFLIEFFLKFYFWKLGKEYPY